MDPTFEKVGYFASPFGLVGVYDGNAFRNASVTRVAHGRQPYIPPRQSRIDSYPISDA